MHVHTMRGETQALTEPELEQRKSHILLSSQVQPDGVPCQVTR